MSHAQHTYLPAAGRDFLLTLYDPMVKLLGADRAQDKTSGCGRGSRRVRMTLLASWTVGPSSRVHPAGARAGASALAGSIAKTIPWMTLVRSTSKASHSDLSSGVLSGYL